MSQRRERPDPALVIVGVDGSVAGAAAIEFGAWEARRRHTTLLLVHGYLDRMPYTKYGWLSPQPIEQSVRAEARSMLDSIENRTRSTHRGLRVHSALVAGGGASSLIELSHDSAAVVVGARGAGGFAELRLGSVSAQVAMHAHAPVIVVPGRTDEKPTDAPVVVGVDGSPAGDGALAFAFDEAAARHVPLMPLYAWWLHPLSNLGPTNPLNYEYGTALQEANRMLSEALAGWRSKYPDVAVQQQAAHSMNPASALIEASCRAGLVVVGSRGRGGFASLLLGSVSQTVVAHAACPVAVIH